MVTVTVAVPDAARLSVALEKNMFLIKFKSEKKSIGIITSTSSAKKERKYHRNNSAAFIHV